MTDFNCQCVDENPNLTLAEYRTKMLQRAGFASIAANPPASTAALFTAFLQDAQTLMYRKYPALRTRRFFRWTLQENERFYGMRENDENWTATAATLTAGTPGVVAFDDDEPSASGRLLQFLPGDYDLPAGITPYTRYYLVNPSGDYASAEIALTADGTPLDFDSTVADVSVLYSPAESCVFNMDPYKNIEGAWLVDLNGQWVPMICGINPTFYTTVLQPALPTYYEIRQCIEIYPSPQAAGYLLYIKGHFGLAAFTEDTDKPTIDGELVYLWALANALDYYGKPSAAGVAAQAREYLQELVAGTHTGKRYVPGAVQIAPAVMPLLAPGQFPGA